MTRLRLRFVCLLSVFAVAAVALAAPLVSGARQPGQKQTRPRQVGRPAPAQSPAPSGPANAGADESVGDDEVVKVDSLEVLLPVTVRDASGALVKNLSRTDQLKRVDALRDEIDAFRRLCDGARAEALKRRHRRRTSPRRSR